MAIIPLPNFNFSPPPWLFPIFLSLLKSNPFLTLALALQPKVFFEKMPYHGYIADGNVIGMNSVEDDLALSMKILEAAFPLLESYLTNIFIYKELLKIFHITLFLIVK